jgi:PncC family amidohydrolase
MSAEDLEYQVGVLLTQMGLSLAVAESCSGGLLSHLITNVPGSSVYYLGGIISYANETKINILGVTQSTLERYGAVSRETALEMARGARLLLAADISLSTTGIAGPGGGTPQKPVGLTWIGLSSQDYESARQFMWQGDRLAVKQQTAKQALRILLDFLNRISPGV